MTSRESNRLRDADKKRVLDEATRKRRARKALEALEQDNFHDDPHADLVMSKKVPKFQDTTDGTPSTSRTRKAKKAKGPDYYKNKYRKNFVQLLEEDKASRSEDECYWSAQAPESKFPNRHFCAVCGFPSPYTCCSCGIRYCSIRCLKTHQDTRCLKWTA